MDRDAQTPAASGGPPRISLTMKTEVEGAARSPWVARLARFGFAARGAIYLLLAYLSIRVAFGQRTLQPNREGALRTIARQRFGHPVLLVLAAGFASYSIWQLVMAVFGDMARRGSDRPGRRVLSLVNAAVYGLFCASAVALAIGSSRLQVGGDKEAVDWSGKVMTHPFGRVVVGLVGAVVIVIGAGLLWNTVTGRREVGLRAPSERTRRWAELLGLFGSGSRAFIVAAAGVFLLEAAVDFDPDKVRGLDGTLKTFAHTPAGPWLLVLVAAGLVAFGLHSLAEARWGDL